MSIWKKFFARLDSRHKDKKYHLVLGTSALFQTDLATQETHNESNHINDSLAVSLPNDIRNAPQYHVWISLSPREQDVTALTCLKFTNRQIAARLGLSVNTVETYLDKTIRRLGIQTKADLRVYFADWSFKAWDRRNSHRWKDK